MRPRYAAGLTLVGVAAFAAAFLAPASGKTQDRLGDACVLRSHAESCEELGRRLERGELASHFPEEAGLYFAIGCEEGSSRSCGRAQVWAKRYSDYETFEIDVGCMLRGNAFACEEVASTLRDETEESGGLLSEARALPLARLRMRRALGLYLDGCSRDDAECCRGAGRVYAGGFGVAWNPREARAMDTKACALGLSEACEAQGDDLIAADPASALALYRKACEHTPASPHACLKLARASEAAGEPATAVANAYRLACERLSLDACAWIARRPPGAPL
jgi:TPR repeat protein